MQCIWPGSHVDVIRVKFQPLCTRLRNASGTSGSSMNPYRMTTSNIPSPSRDEPRPAHREQCGTGWWSPSR